MSWRRAAFNQLWDDHADWSEATFGIDEERGPKGPLKHLEKEVKEALASPYDKEEYADLFLLVIDAARRSGMTCRQFINACRKKLEKCKGRTWIKGEDGVFEHDRTKDESYDIQAAIKICNNTQESIRMANEEFAYLDNEGN